MEFERGRILIVEDEQLVAEHLRATVEKLGYSVTALASTGKDAISQAALAQPDVILMDIHLKGETDGVEAARVISWLFNIPVIFLTAYSQHQRFQQVTSLNPFGYLTKPFSEMDLKHLIEKAMMRTVRTA